MKISKASTLLAVTAAGAMYGASVSAEDWPQWRGPAATGVSRETGLPLKWSDTENIAWRAKLTGTGVSSPIVSGDRVFVTSQTGAGIFREGPRLGQGADTNAAERALNRTGSRGVRFLVEAINRADGRRLWTYELSSEGALPPVHDKHNLASASPVTDGERVYAVFGNGQVAAVDMQGRAVWTRHLGRDFGSWDIDWGNGSSPIVRGGALILVCSTG